MAEPVRTCVVCGTKKGKTELHRFVWQDGSPVADRSGHAAGRGGYCCGESCGEKLLQQSKKWKRIFRL